MRPHYPAGYITFQQFLEEDFAGFSEWRHWPSLTLASYVCTMKAQYERMFPEPPRAKTLSSGRAKRE